MESDQGRGLEEMKIKKGPWAVDEDLLLMNYISLYGEGRWNFLARNSGLRRTGKSCRLRWLNYLRPDIRRGNITPEEQLLILELHSRWGNRWSKIAEHLPGRTDNEIKNYWRTRVEKQARRLHCDVDSKKFRDAMRYLWMPHLLERIRAATAAAVQPPSGSNVGVVCPSLATNTLTAGRELQERSMVDKQEWSMGGGQYETLSCWTDEFFNSDYNHGFQQTDYNFDVCLEDSWNDVQEGQDDWFMKLH